EGAVGEPRGEGDPTRTQADDRHVLAEQPHEGEGVLPAVLGKVRGDEVTEVLLEPAGKHRAGRVDVVVAGDDRAALRRLGDGAQGITRSLELALQRIGGEIAADEQMVR